MGQLQGSPPTHSPPPPSPPHKSTHSSPVFVPESDCGVDRPPSADDVDIREEGGKAPEISALKRRAAEKRAKREEAKLKAELEKDHAGLGPGAATGKKSAAAGVSRDGNKGGMKGDFTGKGRRATPESAPTPDGQRNTNGDSEAGLHRPIPGRGKGSGNPRMGVGPKENAHKVGIVHQCLDRFKIGGVDGWATWCWIRLLHFYRKQEPALDACTQILLRGRDRVQSFARRAWPPVCLGLLFSARVLLTLGLLWLDCGIRGISSLFRLGSAALFLLLSCTALNLTVLAGFWSFLIAVVVAAASAFLFGYTSALAIIGIFGVVVLWIYGSFWMTAATILIAGILFVADHPRLSLLLMTSYSALSARRNGGWLGLFLCTNIAFVLSDLIIYFLRSNTTENLGKGSEEAGEGQQASSNRSQTGSAGFFFGKNSSRSETFRNGMGLGANDSCAPGYASTSGASEGDSASAEEEVARLLSCKDHYAALGMPRFDDIDLSVVKREYRKKAMLVHPDKNMGNEAAEEAFKRLQNAYEVLLDPMKRKCYDDELKREEVIMSLKRFQSDAYRNGRCGSTEDRGSHSEDDVEKELNIDSRRVACKKCNSMHTWICTDRSKLRARWCQECQDYHQAKDGDGWLEQSGQVFFFGLFQKVDLPHAYACAESKIYEVTEWVKCQGLKCSPNTHKPTFHVSSLVNARNHSRGSRGTKNSFGNVADGFSFANLDENMTEQEFFEWLENAMASGMFDDANKEVPGQAGVKGGSRAKISRKKRKGKKQW